MGLVFGAIVGSFLNVVINRTKLNKTLLGRSYCPHCKHTLTTLDLVPILSFMWLKGKCKHCGKRISWQYPIVEAATAIVFFLISLQVDYSIHAVYLWLVSGYFLVIAAYDFKHYLVLDKFVFSGLLVAFIYAVAGDLGSGCNFTWECSTFSGIAAGLITSGFFFLQFYVSKGRWIGFGDVKLGLLLGMVAGFPLVLILLFFSYLTGAIIGLALIAAGKKEMTSKMPFGTFLAIAAIFTLLYGEPILSWYMRLIGLNY